jgi:2'-hydroxyisoflavone reductase
MRLLILGGTLYLGRHLVEAALARGHRVTLFNRGRTNPDLFPEVERITGDRDHDLGALGNREWDAVVDTCGYLPKTVRASAAALANRVGHYAFVSTISVYADNTRGGLVESDAVAEIAPGTPEELTGETYGGFKAICERILAEAFGQRTIAIRAGLIFGPHDATDRSAYWPERLERGGDVLAPGPPERPLQLIDVRDLAEWTIRTCESKTSGIFNATGPAETLRMQHFLEACRAVAGTESRRVWVDEAFLLAHEVQPYNELPLWVPEKYQAFETVNVQAAIAQGLVFRPLEETVRATLEWARSVRGLPRPGKIGIELPPAMTAERERELLARWSEAAATK